MKKPATSSEESLQHKKADWELSLTELVSLQWNSYQAPEKNESRHGFPSDVHKAQSDAGARLFVSASKKG
uniref:Uncharacterized protein n=1 Tax=Ditylenchus dipsaci TaxID=166011 RepID=A0A915CMU6_9BILA